MDSFGTNFLLFTGFVVAIAGIGIAMFSTYSSRMARQMNELTTQELESNYQEALRFLLDHPSDPSAKAACLDHGRAFYEFVIPDAMTAPTRSFVNDEDPAAQSRDAKIHADIAAKLGALKAAS